MFWKKKPEPQPFGIPLDVHLLLFKRIGNGYTGIVRVLYPCPQSAAARFKPNIEFIERALSETHQISLELLVGAR